jgi:hypothetical protein
LNCDEESVDLTSAPNEQQGFRAANPSDNVNLDARVRSIDGGKPEVWLE